MEAMTSPFLLIKGKGKGSSLVVEPDWLAD